MSAATQIDLCVVLVATRNPLNIGAAARAMSNFGFGDLRLVNPYDAAFREARSAVGASRILANARVYQTIADAVADCSLVAGTTAATARDPQQPLLRLEEGASRIRNTASRIALLFGSEKRGLSNDDLSHCHFLVRIPARQEHGSMNLGQAVAICLYELIREDNQAPMASYAALGAPPLPPAFGGQGGDFDVIPLSQTPSAVGTSDVGKRGSFDVTPAASESQERITALLLDCLLESGYFNPATSKDAESRTRCLIRRMNLSEEDAEIWLGILRQILWKLRG